MGRKVDVKGEQFGRLIAIGSTNKRSSSGSVIWECICECGAIALVSASNLKTGNTRSCGCLSKEISSRNLKKAITKHGLYNTRIRRIWSDMKARCSNPNRSSYKYYGSRGITLCSEWLNDFTSFYEWSMNNGYNDSLTIDRIDNDGNYEPDNCRWVDNTTQANNTRWNKILNYKGESDTLANFCRKYNKSYDLVKQRINVLGWSVERAFDEVNYQKAQMYEFDGVIDTLPSLCRRYNKNYDTVRQRIKRNNWDIYSAMNKEKNNDAGDTGK